MRISAALLFLAATLCLSSDAAAQSPAPPAPAEAEAESPSLDWDRDFDLILESRQGSDRENSSKKARVSALEADLERLRKEEQDLRVRREIFAGNVAGEEAFQEMLRLEVSSPNRARDVLDAKIAEVRARITNIEVELVRARRAK